MPKNILIVDDEESAAFFLAENLRELGPAYRVDTASSGNEALSKCDTLSYDLIITDLRMPGMDGLELLRRVRARSPKTKLILMTAYGSEIVESQVSRLAVAHYLNKPFKVEELIAVVKDSVPADNLSPEASKIEDSSQSLARRLEELRFDIGAQWVVLVNWAGAILAQAGSAAGLPGGNAVLPLIGGGCASAVELARCLDQAEALTFCFQEGRRYDVYFANVERDVCLAIFYNKESISVTRAGAVWLYAKRAILDLRERLSTHGTMTVEMGRPETTCSPPRQQSAPVKAPALIQADGGNGNGSNHSIAPSSPSSALASSPASPPEPWLRELGLFSGEHNWFDADQSADHNATVVFSWDEARRMGLIDDSLDKE